jgi:hypothetical protein
MEHRSQSEDTTLLLKSKTPYYWILQVSGAIFYCNVHKEHIILMQREFGRVLSQHFQHHILLQALFAAHKAGPMSDVQCQFDNKTPDGRKKLAQRSDAKEHRFRLHIQGSEYEPVIDDNNGLSDCEPVAALESHLTSASNPASGIKDLVRQYLESLKDENIRIFHSVLQRTSLLIGPCQEKTACKPCILAYQDCWRKTFTPDQLLDRIIPALSQGVAYRADNAHKPADRDEAFRAIALRQLFQDKRPGEVAHCILNIPVGKGTGIQIPPVVSGAIELLSSDSDIVTANIAPQDYVVDLHIGKTVSSKEHECPESWHFTDHGLNALSTVFHDCVKLRVLFPPSTPNLDAFYALRGQECKFQRLALVLEDGMCAITTQGKTLYMPAGWLHATLTVRGGCLLGVNWTRGSDLPMVANIYAREFKADCEEASHQLLLNSGSMACSTSNDTDELWTVLCPLWSLLRDSLKKNPPQEYSKLREHSNRAKVCPGCNKPPASHAVKTRRE